VAGEGQGAVRDVIIVGAGPAGLSAAVHAHRSGLDYLLLERADHLADTIFLYQKGKHVMAEPSLVPLRSPVPFAPGSREAVLGAWEAITREEGLAVRFGQSLKSLERVGEAFLLETEAGEQHRAKSVILAIGTQGTPRELGVPGQELPHVSSRLVDPADVQGEDVVVVGAGDSALEVALALADQNRVALIVRKAEIVRAKEALEREILSRQAAGELVIHFRSQLRQIEADAVEVDGPQGTVRIPAQRVIPKIGTLPPRGFLEGLGIEHSGPGREARPKLSPVYESSVPGLYLIGAVSGRDLIKLGMNQGYEVVEHLLGHAVLPADEEILRQRLPAWSGTVWERIETLREEIPLLGTVEPEPLREALLASETREFGAGETIVRQNDYTDSFLVIAAGEVSISVRPEGATEAQNVGVLEAGNFFGEMSLISGRRRGATAVARTDCRILEFQRKAMLRVLQGAPRAQALVDQTFLLRTFSSYLFPTLPEGLLWQLVGRAETRRLNKGEVLFEEGSPGDTFYLIRNGMVQITKKSGGREMVLSYLVAGNFFGETALLEEAPRTATISAIFPTELIALPKARLDAFLEEHPELRQGILETLEERRVATLAAEVEPGAGQVLSDLIRQEVVMATDVLIIDDHKCVRCGNCIDACEGVHSDRQARLSLTGIKIYNLLAPNSCWQCENPLCMLDCPPDAIVRDPRGEVYIKSNCIGCGNCETNCPYGNIFMVHPKRKAGVWDWIKGLVGVEPEAPESGQTVAVKCDLCRDLSGGPACVRSCPTEAALRLDGDEYRARLEDLVVQRGTG